MGNFKNFSTPIIPNYQITELGEDDGSQSSSGKDSGTGDDLTVDVDGIGVPDPEEGRARVRFSQLRSVS